jgi:hypothetical protein
MQPKEGFKFSGPDRFPLIVIPGEPPQIFTIDSITNSSAQLTKTYLYKHKIKNTYSTFQQTPK